MKRKMKGRTVGFTLIEILVTIASLSVFFGALVVVFSSVTNIVGEARMRAVAVALANDKLEEIRNLSYNDVGTVGGIPDGVLNQDETMTVHGQEYQVHTTVVYVDDEFDDQAPTDPIPTDYKRSSVSVAWGGLFASKTPVYLVSDSAPDGLEMNEGGGTLIVEVINASGEPVGGASVSVYSDQVNPVVDIEALSDSEGRLMLPGAPECPGECYEINVTKSGYSSDRTYSSSEVTNPDQSHVNVLEGQVSQVVLKIDLLSSLSFTVTGSRETGYPPFMGVEFILRGAKTIGTDAADKPVYKYTKNIVTSYGGVASVSDIEWDKYTLELPTGSSVDFAGSSPISPFSLLPGQNRAVKMVVAPASVNTMLVVTINISEAPIASASVTLKGPASYIATKSGGLAGAGDVGQVLFSNLVAGNYDLWVKKQGFIEATGSSIVSGDQIKAFVLNEE